MAHFAKLDEQNTVLGVFVISNDDLLDENGIEQEALGIAVCEQIFGDGVFIQTSYNNTFRKHFACVNGSYDPQLDVFIAPQPYPSWTLDENKDWQPPVPKPDGQYYEWDETTVSWVWINPTPEP